MICGRCGRAHGPNPREQGDCSTLEPLRGHGPGVGLLYKWKIGRSFDRMFGYMLQFRVSIYCAGVGGNDNHGRGQG